jgi:hypothetical protein
MVLVLLLGGGLGWFAHLARQAQIQRDAVAAVKKFGGSAHYDWQFEGSQLRVKKAGLSHLEGLTSFKELRVLETGVTETGLGALRKALPSLRIEHSIQPGS